MQTLSTPVSTLIFLNHSSHLHPAHTCPHCLPLQTLANPGKLRKQANPVIPVIPANP